IKSLIVFVTYVLEVKYNGNVTQIFPRDLRNGSANLTLVCETDGFYPDNLNLTWYKNGTEMATGVNTTIQQISNGLYEASSSVEEIEAVQNGVVYTCQVSHLSLQTPVIANYTVVLPDISRLSKSTVN
uniref:Ig-like domain-containing protein n=1 Tax=Callorhinchus milii TaxID=7868 RepID=A0A4W3H4M5_CALMI